MRCAAVLLLALGAASVAYADSPNAARMERVRKLYAEGDYEGVRRELLAAYEAAPEPALLFALGQVELNLGNYESAIRYYEEFIATNPNAEQVALAQQAIGAARIRLTEPRDPKPNTEPTPPAVKPDTAPTQPPPPPPEKRWTLTHTGLVAFGGAAFLLGTGLLYYSHQLGSDRSGTLSDYDSRLGQARTTRWTGGALAVAGTLLVGVTVVW